MDTTSILRDLARQRVCTNTRRSTNSETGELVQARCMSQNEQVCQSCASLNRMYSMRLIGSGCNVNEQDGITRKSLDSFTFYFVTLTAPSFGKTHTSNGCACGKHHAKGDGIVSTAVDVQRYRYREQVEWNRDSSKLFKHTIDELKRSLVDVEWTAVREWQRRGAIHFHCIVRVTSQMDQAHVFGELARMRSRSWHGTTWGRQFDIKGIRDQGISGTVAYMAKVVAYTAKAQVEDGGGTERLVMRDRLTKHAQRIRCFRSDCNGIKCRGRAHDNFGYAGHLRSQSSKWSLCGLTKQQLHEQRHEFARQMSKSSAWQRGIDFVRSSEAVETLHMLERIHDHDELARRQRLIDGERKRHRERSA